MQLAFGGIMSYRLDDADGQAIFGARKVEYIFSRQTALFLFPVKQLFDFRMFDDGDPLVIVEEPLDHVRD